MFLREILEGLDYELLKGDLDQDICLLTQDSREAAAGSLFVCIHGSTVDSHTFIPKALEQGCRAVVIEEDIDVGIPDGVTEIRVVNSRAAMAHLASAWFGHPTREMKVIGITGTKGKTTTSYMLKSILEHAGHKVGLIGTNGTWIGSEFFETHNTTPDSLELQGYFRRMADAGCDFVVMEVSSQGLMMHRVDAIDFDLGLFTNISPDHISPLEHKDFEEYRACKGLLFRKCAAGIVNTDDPNWVRLVEGHTCRLFAMGMKGEEDFHASDIRPLRRGEFMGVAFLYREEGNARYEDSADIKPAAEEDQTSEIYTVDCGFSKGVSFEAEVAIPGLFSAYNALAAISAARYFGVGQEAVTEALKTVKVNGRMEIVYASDRLTVIVDYAHNGVATHELLRALREYSPKRLVVVFGCGGNRAAARRIEMGEEAGRMADLSIITADNSRYENVEDIMKDIHKGFDPTGGAGIDIADRREAIRYSILNSQPGDMVALIGKGHEDYQEINGVRHHFLDREEAEAALREGGFICE